MKLSLKRNEIELIVSCLPFEIESVLIKRLEKDHRVLIEFEINGKVSNIIISNELLKQIDKVDVKSMIRQDIYIACKRNE